MSWQQRTITVATSEANTGFWAWPGGALIVTATSGTSHSCSSSHTLDFFSTPLRCHCNSEPTAPQPAKPTLIRRSTNQPLFFVAYSCDFLAVYSCDLIGVQISYRKEHQGRIPTTSQPLCILIAWIIGRHPPWVSSLGLRDEMWSEGVTHLGFLLSIWETRCGGDNYRHTDL
jgi:hypothetical protein